jgi:hypothetical protein
MHVYGADRALFLAIVLVRCGLLELFNSTIQYFVSMNCSYITSYTCIIDGKLCGDNIL